MRTAHQNSTKLCGLKCRAGIEAFVCIMRNNTGYHMSPKWFFTNPSMNRYLTGAIKKWDVESIGTKLEAFSIAGCDMLCEWVFRIENVSDLRCGKLSCARTRIG